MTYWTDRQAQLQKSLETDEAKLKKRLSKFYDSEATRLEKEIAAFYTQYGDKGIVEYRTLMEKLPKNQADKLFEDTESTLEMWTMFGNNFTRQDLELSNEAGALALLDIDTPVKELTEIRNNIYKLDRLEGLQTSIKLQQIKMAANDISEIGEHLTKVGLNAANASAEIMGFGKNFYGYNDSIVNTFVNTRWANNDNFSNTIWKNREKLANYLTTDIAQGFARGDSYESLIKNLRQRFDNVSRNDAYRLIYTEGTYVHNEASMIPFTENFMYYSISTVGDNKVCQTCRDIQDLSTDVPFVIDQRTPGENFPPFHPWCRCTFLIEVSDWDAWIDDYVARGGSPVTAEEIEEAIAGREAALKNRELRAQRWVVEPEIEDEISTLIELEYQESDWWDKGEELPWSAYSEGKDLKWGDKYYRYDWKEAVKNSKEWTIEERGVVKEYVFGADSYLDSIISNGKGSVKVGDKFTLKVWSDELGVNQKGYSSLTQRLESDYLKSYLVNNNTPYRFIGEAKVKILDADNNVVNSVYPVLVREKKRGGTLKLFWECPSERTMKRKLVIPQKLKDRVEAVNKELWDRGIRFKEFRRRGRGSSASKEELEAEYQKVNQAFLEIMKADYLPTQLPLEEYFKLKGSPLYRGVSDPRKGGLREGIKTTLTPEQMIVNAYKKELFASRGIYGDGAFYFAIDYRTARNIYAKRINENVMEMKLKDGARTIKWKDACRLMDEIYASDRDWCNKTFFFAPDQRGNYGGFEVGKAMTLLGYDCIIEPHGDGGHYPFYIPLKRGALRYARTSERVMDSKYIVTEWTRGGYW